MQPDDPPSPPPTVLRPTPLGLTQSRRNDEDALPTQGFELSLDPRYFGLFGPPLQRGDIGSLARYRVIALLGEGGMGMVFRAEDVDLGREVALKVMRPEYSADRPLQQRFLREARHTANLQHQHIVTVYQVGEDSGTLFMALELLEGGTLERRLGAGRLTLLEALRIAREMACGLAAAHARGLIHRDVKPDNVWIEAAHGRAKLLDFGLARPDRDSQILTHTGTIIGTPGYMSPEQARAETLDERADLFSLGCVLYRMTTGYGPFPCRNYEEMCKSFKEGPPALIRQLKPQAPAELEALVERLLKFDRNERPDSAREVAEELARIERSLGVEVDLRASLFPTMVSGPRALPLSPSEALAAAPVAPRQASSISNRRYARRIWIVGAAAGAFVVLALVGAVIWWRLHPPGIVRVQSTDPYTEVVFTDPDGRAWSVVPGQTIADYRAKPGPWSVRAANNEESVARPARFDLEAGNLQVVILQKRGEGPLPTPPQARMGTFEAPGRTPPIDAVRYDRP